MREVADRSRIEAFLTALAREATTDTDVFLVGGVFARMEPELFRFPAIDAPSFRRAVDELFPP